MNCREFERLIPEYHDGICRSQKLYAFEGHATVCNDCRERLNEWAKLSYLVKEITPVKAPEDFEASLMRKIKSSQVENPKPGFYRPFELARVFAYAMGLVLVAVSLLMLRDKTNINGRGVDPPIKTIAENSDPLAVHAPDGPSYAPTGDPDFVEVLLKGTGDREVIMRLPATIQVNSPSINEDYYLRNVSH